MNQLQNDNIENKKDLEDSLQKQFLTFMLDGEEYGLEILTVKELRGWDKPTLMPDSPDYIKGVINLRGDIIPIMDLRGKFGLDEVEYNHETVVLVVQIKVDNRIRALGLVVDAVSDVYNVNPKDIKPIPQQGTKIDTKFLQNLVLKEQKIIIVLNVKELISDLEK